ncbi:MAG TPA: ROK family protein [Pyrinomonadaceae bacterium]|nr:ROK family protein [Pyrinomonadaceae bacterium]
MSNPNFVFAVDLGGTHLRTAAIDEAGTIYHHTKSDTPRASEPNRIVSAIVDAARVCEREVGIGSTCVAVPGTVNVETGDVLTIPNVSSLTGFNLGQALQSELNHPVTIENDANAAAMGELWKGAARGSRAMVCVTLGTGVGGGIILNGEIWRGADGAAGEIGHTSVEPHGGVICGCGSEGCLEVYASATALVRMMKETDSTLRDLENLSAKRLYTAATGGDQPALNAFRQMGEYLGIGLAILVNILNPETIVIGGGVSNAWELFGGYAIKEMQRRAFPMPGSRVQVKPGECGDNAGLLGAARLAFGTSERK